MTEELYKRYRPTSFKDLIGQHEAVRMLTEMGRKGSIPHTLLLTGPSGCGKTTIARILRGKLKCGDKDFHEVNAADDRGIDIVREIKQHSGLAPITGACRIWLIDESHQLTPQAQESFLKLLEDTPKHVYFFLATTDPGKLKKTILTRCTEVKVKPLGDTDARQLLANVTQAEGKQLDQLVVDKIVAAAEGSARKLLVILHQVIDLADEDEQLAAVDRADSQRTAVEVAKVLLNPKSKWSDITPILKSLEDDPESVRWCVLGYVSAVAINKPNPVREIQILEAFLEPFYNSKKAGLVQACAVILLRG